MSLPFRPRHAHQSLTYQSVAVTMLGPQAKTSIISQDSATADNLSKGKKIPLVYADACRSIVLGVTISSGFDLGFSQRNLSGMLRLVHRWKFTKLSKECIASIFSIEGQARQINQQTFGSILAGHFFRLLSHLEDGGNIFLCNIFKFLPHCTTSNRKR
jgi:hypothetical protein